MKPDAAQVHARSNSITRPVQMPKRGISVENPWDNRVLRPETYKLPDNLRRGIKKGSSLPSGLKPYTRRKVAVDGVFELRSRTRGYISSLVQLLIFGGVVGGCAFCLTHDIVAHEIENLSEAELEKEVSKNRGINVCEIPNGLTWTFMVIAIMLTTCALFRILLIKHVTTTFNLKTKMIQYSAHQFLNLDVTALVLDYSQASCWRATATVTWCFSSTRKVGYSEDSSGSGTAWAVVGEIQRQRGLPDIHDTSDEAKRIIERKTRRLRARSWSADSNASAPDVGDLFLHLWCVIRSQHTRCVCDRGLH